jgi:transcriptional regulator with XRE-family HTH domain
MRSRPAITEVMDLRATVGRNVRRRREELGLAQDELAHRAEIHVTYLSGVENGRRNITLSVLERLAGSLQVSAAELLARKG